MNDTPNRPRSGLWPLAAMALLLGLLTTFLILVWVRREEEPLKPAPIHTVDSRPVATTSRPVAPVETTSTAPQEKPPTPAEDPRDREVLAKLDEARKALVENDLAGAQKAVAAAKAIKSIDAIAGVEESIRVAIKKREQEERDRIRKERDARAAKAIEDADALRSDNKYMTAEKRLLDEIQRDEELRKHPDIERMLEKIQQMKAGALGIWQDKVKGAEEAAKAGRFAAALLAVRQARIQFADEPRTDAIWNGIVDQMRTGNMVRIPGGMTYKLGTAGRKEEPEREYKGPGFLMDVSEVTNEDYYAFVLATNHAPPASRHWMKNASGGMEPAKTEKFDLARFPVSGVTAADAEEFAKWLGKRLPTEDEWEYAARAIDGRVYPWGNDFPTGKDLKCNSVECARLTSMMWQPVGALANGASAYGVLDLAGNVAEWTATTETMGDRKVRVIKGGSFVMPAEGCRAAARLMDDPLLSYPEVGFRCVKDLGKK